MPTPLEIIPSVEATPIVDEPKLVEENVPIKKYYGRKRDDQSSSEDSDYSYDVNIVPPTNTTKYLFRVHNSVHWIFIYSFCFFFLLRSSDATSSTTAAAKSTNLGKAASLHTKVSKNNTIVFSVHAIQNTILVAHFYIFS